jgi:hypothetical protein
MARIPAARIARGVSKSNSPWLRVITSRPCLISMAARWVMAFVPEGRTAAIRCANLTCCAIPILSNP